MCLLVRCHQLVLPAMYVLVGVVPPVCLPRYICAGWCCSTPSVEFCVCATFGGATPLCCLLCMFWSGQCHPLLLPAVYALVGAVPPLVMPAMYVLVGVVPPLVLHARCMLAGAGSPNCVVSYICACWGGATPKSCPLCMLLLVWCHPLYCRYLCAG